MQGCGRCALRSPQGAESYHPFKSLYSYATTMQAISRLETLESLWLAEGLTRACIAMVPACINMPDVTSLLHCSGFTKVSHYRSRP